MTATACSLKSWMPLPWKTAETSSAENLTAVKCVWFCWEWAGYVKDLDTELYIYPTVALSMKHSLWPSVLSDRATVYTRKLTGDLWLWRKWTKSPGIYQRLSNWTCMFLLMRALHLDSDWYLGKRYMKREANGIYSVIIFQGQDTDFHPEQCQLKKKEP